MTTAAGRETDTSTGPARTPGAPIPQDTVLAALQRAVTQSPDQVFLDFSGELSTYRELAGRVTRLANEFARLGIGTGDTVAGQLDNSSDQILAWFATNTLGAIWVPINTAYRGEFLRHQLADSTAILALCETEYVDRILAVAPDTMLRRILVRGSAPSDVTASLPVERLDDHRGIDDTPIPVSARPGDVSCLIYTSGTTGPSKGCVYPHNFLCNQGRQLGIMMSMSPSDVSWTCLPLFHASALSLVTGTLLQRGRVAVEARFSVNRFWPEIERSRATLALLMASIFPWIAHAPDSAEMQRSVGQLRMVTGVPVTEEVRQIWKDRFGVRHVNTFGYGQSEGVLLAYSPETDPAPLDSCGRIAHDEAGAPIQTVRKLLGHASLTTTQIYTHSNTDADRAASEQLIQLLAG